VIRRRDRCARVWRFGGRRPGAGVSRRGRRLRGGRVAEGEDAADPEGGAESGAPCGPVMAGHEEEHREPEGNYGGPGPFVEGQPLEEGLNRFGLEGRPVNLLSGKVQIVPDFGVARGQFQRLAPTGDGAADAAGFEPGVAAVVEDCGAAEAAGEQLFVCPGGFLVAALFVKVIGPIEGGGGFRFGGRREAGEQEEKGGEQAGEGGEAGESSRWGAGVGTAGL